jgi:hypothetical protein
MVLIWGCGHSLDHVYCYCPGTDRPRASLNFGIGFDVRIVTRYVPPALIPEML